MGLRILQLQRIADSSFFWARILDFVCNKSIFAWISDSGEILMADLLNKSQQIGGFAYPYSLLSSYSCPIFHHLLTNTLIMTLYFDA